MYIALEGIDGSGKSSQIPNVIKCLKERGFTKIEQVWEPGTTIAGEAIRNIIFQDIPMNKYTEMFLMMAARAQLICDIIVPAQQEGKVIVSDRSVYSTLAYQCARYDINPEMVEYIHRFCMKDIWPNLVLLYDAPVEVCLRRIEVGKDRFTPIHLELHNARRTMYLEMANRDKARFRIIPADRSVEELNIATRSALYDYINKCEEDINNPINIWKKI